MLLVRGIQGTGSQVDHRGQGFHGLLNDCVNWGFGGCASLFSFAQQSGRPGFMPVLNRIGSPRGSHDGYQILQRTDFPILSWPAKTAISTDGLYTHFKVFDYRLSVMHRPASPYSGR